jgi:hypothetical protein
MVFMILFLAIDMFLLWRRVVKLEREIGIQKLEQILKQNQRPYSEQH